MVTSTAAYFALLGGVALERLAELHISRRNGTLALAQGGREHGAASFRVMAIVHTLFLVACGAEVLLLHRTVDARIGLPALALTLGAQALRWWCIATLGPRWNVRVIVVPALTPVTAGPYRWLRHPNYLAVIVEIAALPLVHGAWLTALVFTALNAALLAARIRTEEAALGGAYAAVFAQTPRLVPRPRSDA
ncbi:MAG: isoprenylcysteine carboxyl methyltransferase family protein [Gemmatimonadaceae bacterium]